MKLPIFNIMAGFVEGVDVSAAKATLMEPVFVYDTQYGSEIGVLCEDGTKLAEALGSMARLMGIPCVIRITYIEPYLRSIPSAAFRVVVHLPYHLRKDIVEEEMEMKSYFGMVTVGFKELPELTDASMNGK
ncbi:MAG TPA: hypothetical protein PKH46_07110 [Candidatus Cryosericum sp.]|nr:hypothetical protein [Candidatus Cryosericum sp.]